MTKQTVALLRPNDNPLVRLRCCETGETATVAEWAEKVSENLQLDKGSVRVGLYRVSAGKQAGKAYGLTWVRVGPDTNESGVVVMSTPADRKSAPPPQVRKAQGNTRESFDAGKKRK